VLLLESRLRPESPLRKHRRPLTCPQEPLREGFLHRGQVDPRFHYLTRLSETGDRDHAQPRAPRTDWYGRSGVLTIDQNFRPENSFQ
jgi:hypothetical protein